MLIRVCSHSDFVYIVVVFFQLENAVALAVAKQIHITPTIPSCLGGSREAKKYSDYDNDDSDTQDGYAATLITYTAPVFFPARARSTAGSGQTNTHNSGDPELPRREARSGIL